MGRQDRRAAYAEKLRDPRWQKRRLEIMLRDAFTCQLCLTKDKTLNVHHLWYEPKAEPWEHPDASLVTLCEVCHADETLLWQKGAGALVRCLQRAGVTSAGLAAIALAFESRQLTFAEAQELPHRIAEVIRPTLTRVTVGVKGEAD